MSSILDFPKVMLYIADWNVPFARRIAGSQHSVLFLFHMLSLSFIVEWIPVFQLLAEIAINYIISVVSKVHVILEHYNRLSMSWK